MKITPETKVHDLLQEYPYLKQWLVGYAPEFEKLTNPVLYNTVGRVAAMDAVAAMGNVPLDKFLDDIRTEVAKREIMAQEAAGAAAASAAAGASGVAGASGAAGAAAGGAAAETVPGTGSQVSDEIRAKRQESLKGIIRKLHEGASVDEVKREFDQLVAEVDSAEIAQMEQALIAEGMPVEEVQRLCDVHVTVFKEALEEKPGTTVPEGHPVSAYQRENVVISEIVNEIRCSLDTLTSAGEDHGRTTALHEVRTGLDRLSEVRVHYLRKENQLFPVLEKHGVEGPTKVMWALDDDIIGRIKTAQALAEAADSKALATMLPEVLGMVEDMVYKEEKILLPTAMQVVTPDEWADMAAGDAEIGFAWIEGSGSIAARAAIATTPATEGPMLLPLPTGALSLEQLDLLFRALPFDCTYVDENDTVRFYSEGERVFPRSPAAIGRQVRNCHPPKSVHKVEEILTEFKAGTKDVAEFWIEATGRFIHIRYFALRDAEKNYKGCLEVVQDATHVRSLTGQRRIVDW